MHFIEIECLYIYIWIIIPDNICQFYYINTSNHFCLLSTNSLFKFDCLVLILRQMTSNLQRWHFWKVCHFVAPAISYFSKIPENYQRRFFVFLYFPIISPAILDRSFWIQRQILTRQSQKFFVHMLYLSYYMLQLMLQFSPTCVI